MLDVDESGDAEDETDESGDAADEDDVEADAGDAGGSSGDGGNSEELESDSDEGGCRSLNRVGVGGELGEGMYERSGSGRERVLFGFKLSRPGDEVGDRGGGNSFFFGFFSGSFSCRSVSAFLVRPGGVVSPSRSIISPLPSIMSSRFWATSRSCLLDQGNAKPMIGNTGPEQDEQEKEVE
jgi:hypothetical protein